MDAAIKYPPNNPMNFEGDAEAVTYGGGKLNTTLNYLSNLNFSTFGKKLIAADEAEFKRLLGVRTDDIWDECQNKWNLNTATLSTGQKKFGTQSLRVTSSTTATEPRQFRFGGSTPFTISFWVRLDSFPSSPTTFFKAVGSSSSFGVDVDKPTSATSYRISLNNGTAGTTLNAALIHANKLSAATWGHIEICYNGSTTYFFVNGNKASAAVTLGREVRQITFGGLACYIDEFRLLDGTCAHTAAFTPPTSAYSVESTTMSLLHFE